MFIKKYQRFKGQYQTHQFEPWSITSDETRGSQELATRKRSIDRRTDSRRCPQASYFYSSSEETTVGEKLGL